MRNSEINANRLNLTTIDSSEFSHINSPANLEEALAQATELVEDMSNVEYTRGVCELIARLFPAQDVCTGERSEWVMRAIDAASLSRA